jgi:hypothetical protein
MPFSVMLHRVAVVGIGVSEERRASVIRVTRIDELGTTLVLIIGIFSQRASVASYS